jgi:hypothetical protein
VEHGPGGGRSGPGIGRRGDAWRHVGATLANRCVLVCSIGSASGRLATNRCVTLPANEAATVRQRNRPPLLVSLADEDRADTTVHRSRRQGRLALLHATLPRNGYHPTADSPTVGLAWTSRRTNDSDYRDASVTRLSQYSADSRRREPFDGVPEACPFEQGGGSAIYARLRSRRWPRIAPEWGRGRRLSARRCAGGGLLRCDADRVDQQPDQVCVAGVFEADRAA